MTGENSPQGGSGSLTRHGDGSDKVNHRSDLRREDRRGPSRLSRPGLALVAFLAVLVILGLLRWGAADRRTSPSRGEVTTTTAPAHRAGAPGGASAGGATTTTLANALSSGGPGSMPQTQAFPSSSSPAFQREMAALFAGIKQDSLSEALVGFFPEAAYLRIKRLSSPRVDYEDRLLVEFQLDVAAAHRALGSDAGAAQFVRVMVPNDEASWIGPGQCHNSTGYFHVPGARLVYTERGHEHSIGIASMISWRGQWYVVHFGVFARTRLVGYVDDPSPGEGVFGPPGGC